MIKINGEIPVWSPHSYPVEHDLADGCPGGGFDPVPVNKKVFLGRKPVIIIHLVAVNRPGRTGDGP